MSNLIFNKMTLSYITGASLLVFMMTACSDDDHHFGENMIPVQGGGSTGTTSSGSSILDFSIAFDETDEETYGSMEDEVVTDPSDESYYDFIEHQDFSTVVTVTYNGTTAEVTSYPDGIDVEVDGAHVVVNSKLSNVSYKLSGETDDGSFKIYSDDAFCLSLCGVSLLNPDGAAINIQSSERAFIVTKGGTNNTLTDGDDYDTKTSSGEKMKACLYSTGGLIFGGEGYLSVTGNNNHAITSDDHIRFRSGCHVTVESAANDGIHTDNQITIGGGIIYITSVGDCIQCGDEGITMTGGFAHLSTSEDSSDGLKAETGFSIFGGAVQVEIGGRKGKGINCASFAMTDGKITVINSGEALYDEDDDDISSAAGIKCDGDMSISGGQLALLSSGAAGKGINCDGDLSVSGGTVQVQTTGTQFVYGQLDSSAKGVKADGDITISGDAVVQVKATGGEGSEGIESKSTLRIDGGQVASYCYDDAMNASDAIEINGGTIYCYSTGNDGIDSNGTLTVTGGLTIAVGTDSPEGGIDCDENTFTITGGILLGIGGETSTPTSRVCTQPSLIYSGSVGSGNLIHIASSDGTDVLTYEVPENYSRMTLLFSRPSLQSGSSYTIYSGGSVSDGTEFYGYYSDGTYSGGTELYTFTLNSMVTNIGSNGGGKR